MRAALRLRHLVSARSLPTVAATCVTPYASTGAAAHDVQQQPQQRHQRSTKGPGAARPMSCDGACRGLGCGGAKHGDGLGALLKANRDWAAEMLEKDPEFFDRLVEQQNPEYLWIGCSDSRVPANQILGLQPGEIFVQRNVGNQAMHTDMNLMACLEYAVKSLKVKSIILCGHYSCGAVKAALQLPHTTPGLVNCWISDIRECRNQSERELRGLDPEQQLARLCELNVLRQVFHVATSPVVAGAWADGQELHLYGLIYDLADGHLRKLVGPISGDDCYDHSLDGFVSGGLQVTRCPQTQLLRVSAAEEVTVPREPSSSDGSPPCAAALLPLLSSPSELMSSINNINIAESLAKHKQWGQSSSARSSRKSLDLPSPSAAAAHSGAPSPQRAQVAPF